MKYVVFSFDDGRKDFYTNALPILKKYGMTATVNVIGDFIGGHAPKGFLSSNNEFMTLADIVDSYECGIEIGNHAMNHTNDLESVRNFKINNDTVDGGGYGFASPGSEVCKKNAALFTALVASGKLLYIRSGRQIKRDGLVHAALYVLLRKIKSPFLFWLYQKRNVVVLKKRYDFYPSLAIDSFTTAKEIRYVLKKLRDGQAAILMFHSVLSKNDAGYGKDKWFNDIDMFEDVCQFCAQDKNICVITNRQLCEIQKSGGRE